MKGKRCWIVVHLIYFIRLNSYSSSIIYSYSKTEFFFFYLSFFFYLQFFLVLIFFPHPRPFALFLSIINIFPNFSGLHSSKFNYLLLTVLLPRSNLTPHCISPTNSTIPACHRYVHISVLVSFLAFRGKISSYSEHSTKLFLLLIWKAAICNSKYWKDKRKKDAHIVKFSTCRLIQMHSPTSTSRKTAGSAS